MTQRGKLYVITAPSGAGKTTLVHELIGRMPQLTFSISFTTRPMRSGEVNGKDYHFVSEDEFNNMAAGGEFLEHAQVFDHHYATGRHAVESVLETGANVLLEIDWQGAAQVRANMPEACLIFILPPSLEELERRLRGRGTDTDEVIERRFGDAVSDMSHWKNFDHVIINEDLDRATDQLAAILDGGGQETAVDRPELRRRIEQITAPAQ